MGLFYKKRRLSDPPFQRPHLCETCQFKQYRHSTCIIGVNRKRVTGAKDYEAIVSKIEPGQDILLLRTAQSSCIIQTSR